MDKEAKVKRDTCPRSDNGYHQYAPVVDKKETHIVNKCICCDRRK